MHIPLTPIRCLYRAADLYGRKEGVICGDKRFTYAQFTERCERLAAGLRSRGIQTGDRVAYLSFNTHQLLEGYFGVVMAGAIVMPLNVRLTPAELITILNHAGAVALLFEADFAPLIEQFRNYCPALTHYISLDGPNPLAPMHYEELLSQAVPERVDFMTVDETAPAELFYTSGSTGSPKGVVLSHRTLYLHALQVAATFVKDDRGVELHTIPLFHANGWSRPQTCTLMGVKQVMIRRFDPALVFRLIEAERATSMSLVPIMAGALLQSPDLRNHEYSSLVEIHVGGAAASPELLDRLEKTFGCPATAGYGLTETSPVATDGRLKDGVVNQTEAERLYRQSMAGWPIPGTEVRVVDAEMRDVPRDMATIGEIVIRGDNVMDGYYRESAATHAVMTGAWFHTGDMAIWDIENYVHIVDRRKDIIISGGENISSIEVEKAISAHPAVLECAVVAAPDQKWGEVPVAFVVHAPGDPVNEELLGAYLAGRLGEVQIAARVAFHHATPAQNRDWKDSQTRLAGAVLDRQNQARSGLDIFLAFLRLGCTSFGGPAAHLGYFRDELVVRRRWLSEATLAEFIGLTQLLPGPSSSQTGFLIGISRGGIMGGLAAWLGFTLPSAVLMILFAMGASRAQGKIWIGALHGLQVAAVAVVATAVLRMFRTLCPDLARALIAMAAAAFVLFRNGAVAQIGAIVAGGIFGALLFQRVPAATDETNLLPVSKRGAFIALGVFVTILACVEFANFPGVAQARAFYRTGALVFGGGHVVLPLLEQAVVRPGWVTENDFLAGYGAVQALPGPLFTFSAFLGYSSRVPPNGVPGAILCLAAIFLPGLLLAIAIAPFWGQWRRLRRAQAVLAGVNAAVVGMLITALIHAGLSGSLATYWDSALAIAGFLALVRTRLSPVIVVLASAAISASLAVLIR